MYIIYTGTSPKKVFEEEHTTGGGDGSVMGLTQLHEFMIS